MTSKNDRASPGRDAGMAHPDASDVLDIRPDLRRLPPILRIVHSTENPVEIPTIRRPRPAWAEALRQEAEQMPEKCSAMLDRSLQARIGGMLREVFSDLADAPVPERFVDLLEALDAKDTSSE